MTGREAILEIIKSVIRDKVYYGTVKPGSVAGGLCTVIDVDDEDHEFLAVRLQANPGSGVLMIPADNSMVVIMEVQPMDYAVVLFSEITSIKFRDGSKGGLINVEDLVSKINVLENKMNAIIAGTGFGGPPIAPTVRGDIENTAITHG